jgi:hypothetical protein
VGEADAFTKAEVNNEFILSMHPELKFMLSKFGNQT